MKTFTFRPKLFSSLKGYSKETFTADLMAGIIVGIVALPLAIAFGIASGVSPEKGIITAIIAGFVISLLGGSKVQIGGPTGAFIVIVYGIIARYGETGLIVATIMAGAILVMLGVFKLGTVIKFIPYPIVVGFTSGIAVTIFTTQIKDLLGLSADSVPADFLPKWQCYFENIGTADPLSVVVGIGSIAIIALWPRISKKIPGSLVAIFAMTLLTYLLRRYAGVTSIETIGDRFQISASLPGVAVPDMSWDVIKGLFPAAVTIAVLGAIESLLSATVADGVTGDKHDSNQELIAQGAANIVTPLFGGIPATGAIARTMTNINNGGKTPVAGLIHAAVLLLILLCLGPLTRHIPMACLAGVLVIVAYNMSEWRTFRALMSNPKADVAVLLVTFLLTVLFDLTVAILLGVIYSAILYMAKSSRIRVAYSDIDSSRLREDVGKSPLLESAGVVYVTGSLFFGAVDEFNRRIASLPKNDHLIFSLRGCPSIDVPGAQTVLELSEKLKAAGTNLSFCGLSEEVRSYFDRAGVTALVGESAYFNSADQAILSLLDRELLE